MPRELSPGQFWMEQPTLLGIVWVGLNFFCYKTCNSTSNEGGKQLSNDHHIREIFPQIHATLMLWLPAVWPIKKLTLHNTHQGKEGEMENFRLFVGCYVRRTLYSTKHFTDRRPSAKVPVAPKTIKQKAGRVLQSTQISTSAVGNRKRGISMCKSE